MTATQSLLEELLADPPQLHFTGAGAESWTVGNEVLRWLAATISPDWRTLETGCGHSSIVFMLSGATHTIVAPYDLEHELARQWCAERGISTDRTISVIEHSGEALPRLGDDPLDLALIDGGHAFPMPFLDWYYIGKRLRVGGYLLVDDIQLATCRLLDDFLRAESSRWEHVDLLGSTSIFRRTSEILIPMGDWTDQPWVAIRSVAPTSPLRRVRALLRPRARLRRALRAARQR